RRAFSSITARSVAISSIRRRCCSRSAIATKRRLPPTASRTRSTAEQEQQTRAMTFQTFLFYVFSAILVFAALRVVTARNPVHAALWLVLSFVTAAAHWLMLQAEFLAIVLVLVYVGAVMVLF